MATAKASNSRFVPNPMLEAELARSTMLGDDMEDVAEAILQKAQELAPVEEGYFKENMRTEMGIDDGVITGRFISDDWKSVFIEYGTVEHAFNAPIRRAIESLGLKLERR